MPIDERRAQLIAATARVISREGVAGATTRRIADEAGAPLASLHYSFRNKEDLFAAVIEFGVEQTAALIAAREIAPGSGLVTAVSDYLQTYRTWALADPDMMVAQYSLLTWMLRSPDGRTNAARAYRQYTDGLMSVLTRAATRGERDVKLRELAELAIAVADGMILQLTTFGPEALESIKTADIAEGLIHTARQ